MMSRNVYLCDKTYMIEKMIIIEIGIVPAFRRRVVFEIQMVHVDGVS